MATLDKLPIQHATTTLSWLLISGTLFIAAFSPAVNAENATNTDEKHPPTVTQSIKKSEKTIAETSTSTASKDDKTHKTPSHHKLVIQVSSADLRIQQIALNNAVNLQKHYGMDNIDIEIVAYGPGLSMLTANHTLAPRISSLIYQDIKFSACGNTMHSIKEKTGFLPKLVEDVGIVHAGVARIIELQEQGYAYIRP